MSEITKMIKKEHGISLSDVSPEIIGDFLVFQIQHDNSKISTDILALTKQRKSRKKRNRTKTRGWKVLGKVITDSGILANVYEPFYNALKAKDLSKKEQYEITEKILKANGNKPSRDTIEYFQNNTLKYIREEGKDA